jgi:hypothetical protein
MKTVGTGTPVDVTYRSQLYASRIVRIGKRVVWIASFEIDGKSIDKKCLMFNRKTGEGWGTSLYLFPVNDNWIHTERKEQ